MQSTTMNKTTYTKLGKKFPNVKYVGEPEDNLRVIYDVMSNKDQKLYVFILPH